VNVFEVAQEFLQHAFPQATSASASGGVVTLSIQA